MASYPAHRPGAPRAEQARGARSGAAGKAAPTSGGKWAAALALQRRVGNAALTRMLEEREATAKDPAAVAPGGATRDVPDNAIPVQRNVGLEIEDSNWHTFGDNEQLLRKGEPVVHRNYFQLQAEDPNHVEMVTDPPGMANRGDYTRMKTSMLQLEGELLSQHYRVGMAGKAARFRANRLEGGVSDAYLQPGARWSPHLQVTAGIPLAGIPTFFQRLKGESVNVQTRKADEVEARLKDLLRLPAPATAPTPVRATTGAGSDDAPRPEYRAPSRELLGFTELVNHYLYEGANRPHAQFAKAVYAVMARTDFAASFRLLDAEEQAAIDANLTEWVGLMVSSFAYNAAGRTQGTADDRVLGARIENAFGAGDDVRAGRVNTSREDWLRGMVHGHDLLSTHGRSSDPTRGGDTERDQLGWDVEVQDGSGWQPAVNESLEDLRQLMQGLGGLRRRTDRATYRDGDSNQDRVVPAVIVEVRQTTGVTPGAGGWVATADGVYDAVEAAIADAGTSAEAVVPEPSAEPSPAVRRDTRREAIKRRVRNNASDLVLKARKLTLRR